MSYGPQDIERIKSVLRVSMLMWVVILSVGLVDKYHLDTLPAAMIGFGLGICGYLALNELSKPTGK